MARDNVGAARNARLTPIVEYGIDPVGWGMFGALSRVAQRATDATQGIAVLERIGKFTGYTTSPQHFAGMAPLGLSTPVVPAVSNIGDERSAMFDDTALRIFAERLRRGNP